MQAIACEVKKIDIPDLLVFFAKERKKLTEYYKVQGEYPEDWDLLQDNSNELALMDAYGLYACQSLVGFCLVPVYDQTLLSRVYIQPERRRSGIGSQALSFLGIKSLGCLKTNTSAVDFYLRNGFVITPKYSPHIHYFEKS